MGNIPELLKKLVARPHCAPCVPLCPHVPPGSYVYAVGRTIMTMHDHEDARS